jgi:hydrogenase-4 membrane subunit HyfE
MAETQVLEMLTRYGLTFLEITLIFLAFLITRSDSIPAIIRNYQAQSLVIAAALAISVLLKIHQQTPEGYQIYRVMNAATVAAVFILPLILMASIRQVLMLATLSNLPRGINNWLSKFWRLSTEERREVELTWRNTELATLPSAAAGGKDSPAAPPPRPSLFFRNRTAQDMFFFGVLVAVAFLVAYQIFPQNGQDRDPATGLAVALGLHLVGLYNTISKRDIISQVIGLMVMDHGLYLAVTKIVSVPVPANFFIIALYMYTVITILILVLMIPQVIRKTGEGGLKTIDLDVIASTSPLSERIQETGGGREQG